MATGLSYEQVRTGFGDYYQPDLGTWNILKALKRLCVKVQEVEPRILLGERALVSYKIGKINGISYSHTMYWDGAEMHDPAHAKREYKEIRRVLKLI